MMWNSKFLLFFEKAIQRIENLKINAFVPASYFLFLISVRDLFEQLFFEDRFSIYQMMHHSSFDILVLMAGILIISFLGKIDIIKVMLVVLSGIIVIVLPPLIDRLFFFRQVPYEYLLPNEFMRNIFTFFYSTPKAGLGILIEIAAILLLASFYVLIKSRSPIRAFLTGTVLYLLVGLAATPRLYLPIPDMSNLTIWHARHVIYFGFYFGLSLILGIFFLYRVNNKLPVVILRELGSFRTLHFILMVMIGVYFNKHLSFVDFPDFLYISISIIIIAIIWLCTVLVNNVYDLPIDKISNPNRPLVKGEVNSTTYLNLSYALSVTGLFLSLVLGIIPFFIALISLLSSLAYSMPPLRLRTRLLSTMFIGWGSVLAFLCGYFTRSSIFNITISSDAFVLAPLIFFAFSIGPMTKDLKDYQGDLKHGVKTFFTVYGMQKGKKIVAVFLWISLLIPLPLFHRMIDFIFFGVVAALISLRFYFREKLIISYVGYGIVFSYCVVRELGIVQGF